MCLSPSIAHVLLTRSPWHAFQRHRLGGGMESEPTDATRRGHLIERLLLGSDEDIIVVNAKDWRTNAAKEIREGAEAAGKVAVLADKFEAATSQVAAIRGRIGDATLLAGSRQLTVEWESDGVACKGKLDIWNSAHLLITDLKTCDDASDDAVSRSIVNYGADIQHAAYIEGVEASGISEPGRTRFHFVHVEPDFGVAVVRSLSGTLAELGARKWARAKRIWRRCIDTGVWPSYESRPIEAKPWQLDEEMRQESEAT
jgi:hypothetical protein